MTATTVTDATLPNEPPKHILVNGEKIKLRFLQTILWSVVGAAIGAYMVSALYYLITQVHWDLLGHSLWLKPHWDHLFKYGWWTPARHDYRDCYEAVFATLFIKSIVAKRKTGHVAKLVSKVTHKPARTSSWDKRVATWRVVTSPLLIFAVAFPIITLGIWIVDIHNSTLPTDIHTYQSYLIGFVAAQVVHRFYAPIGNTVQLHFVDEMLSRNITPRFPLPPVLRERYAWMKSTGQMPVKTPSRVVRFIYPVLGLVLLFLAAYGAYVRFVIAKA